MIARLWSARAHDADAYQSLFTTDVLSHLRSVDGFRGAYLLRHDREFMTVTLFESWDAVRAFAGEDYESANVSEAARQVLDDLDVRVRHFTVVLAA